MRPLIEDALAGRDGTSREEMLAAGALAFLEKDGAIEDVLPVVTTILTQAHGLERRS